MAVEVGAAFISVRPELRGFHNTIRRELRSLTPELTRIGQQWGQSLKRGLESQLRGLKIDVHLNTGRIMARLTALNQALERLDGRTINITVNVDMGGAAAQLASLNQVLGRLDGRTINIQVDADTAGALTQMAAVRAASSSLDRQSVGVNVFASVGPALSGIASVQTALIGLAVAAAPALAGIGAGVLGLVGPLSAAAAGFGGLAAVALPAINRIREATQQQERASKAAAGAAGQEQARASAVAAARQQLAAAIRHAAEAHRQALERVRDAELDLADAQRRAKQAQEELNRAREQARRDLQDLANDVASARLAERQAVFDLQDAERELARLRADPAATEDQIARQQLAVDQARQRLKEQRLMLQRLIQDEERARKAGVEGSDRVRDARERLAEANRRIAESERRLAEARRNVARVDRDAADQVASARRALANANRQAAASTGALTGRMVQLTSWEKQLAAAWQSLTDVFEEWNKALQPAVLPVLIKGITLLKNLLPLLTPVVKGAAQGLGQLLDAANAAAKSPFWTQFADFLGQTAGPAIAGFGKLLGSLMTGLAAMAQAWAPVGFAFLEVLQIVTDRFAAAMMGLANSPAFQAFIDQFVSLVPLMADTLSAIGGLFSSIFAGLAPAIAGSLELLRGFATALGDMFRGLGPAFGQVFNALGPAVTSVMSALVPVVVQLGNALAPLLVQLINGLAPILTALAPILSQVISYLQPVIASLLSGLLPVLSSLVPVIGLFVQLIGRILVALAPVVTVLGEFIAELLSGLLPIMTPIVDAFAAMAEEIAAGLIVALRQSTPALQEMLLAVASLLPELVPLIPLFAQWMTSMLPLLPVLIRLASAIVVALVPVLRIAIRVVVWLATTVLSWLIPVMQRLVGVVTWVGGILTPIVQGIGWVLRSLGTAAMWLWRNAIAPAFRGIATIAQWLYSFVVVVLVAPLLLAFKLIQAAVLWLWRSVIRPAFNGISSAIRTAWTSVIKPTLNTVVGFLQRTLGPVFTWIYEEVIKPVWNKVSSTVQKGWNDYVKPAFDSIKRGVGKVGDAFETAVTAIAKAWDGLKDAAKKPVAFVINTVFNGGIVKIWNAVAKLVPGVKELRPIPGFASGGIYDIYPGYTPGRDIGLAAVSGGEAIMRPEFTKAVGEDFIHGANAAARAGGVSGVIRFLTGVGDPGGIAGVPFAGHFFLGGIVKKFSDAAKGFFAGGLKKAAEKAFKPMLALTDRTLGNMGAFGELIAGVPRAMVSKILDFFAPLEEKLGGPGRRAVAAARKQIGVPYSWGGGGLHGPTRGIGRGANTVGFDCSGLMRYAWYQATGKVAPRTTYQQIPWVKRIPKPVPGAFGFPHSGHVFMASDKPGKIIEAPYTGAHVRETTMRHAWWGMPPWKFDDGGWLPPGIGTFVNATRKPEAILTDAQWRSISEAVRGGDGEVHYHAHFDGMTKAAYEAQVRAGIQAEMVLAAQRDRTGRRK
ncbi:NlpC/P60 family protein [uncultured Thermomonospora sp.]|uniref:NlpC/P60 family protein n=1 Tax=uncultured Thermomonospora sp. TaxID=671175 RepID=UPI00259B5C3E|nr:NlpC/P60 family protein [uncultured Thermomonospora sp.]